MPMMFADPTYDTAFKRLFSNKGHSNLTTNFLNAVLDRKDGYLIEKIIFTNTEKTPRFAIEKKTYIDIQCTDQAGNEFIIEMQSAKESFFGKRVQYYVAHELSRQLDKNGFYTNLKPVIFIGVLDFKLFELKTNKDVISHHLITNQATGQQDLKLMEIHFIELPKFKKTEKELKSGIDLWLYFLQQASKLESIPKVCAQSAEVKEAFEIMERATWNKEDWLKYEEERKLQIYLNTQEHAEQQEKEQAVKKEKESIAIESLKEGLKIDIIAKITGLSIEAIEALRKKL